jgi:hypothetical protein
MRKPAVQDFFARLIQRVAPKSYDQAVAEVRVTRKFYENFGGDQVRAVYTSCRSAGVWLVWMQSGGGCTRLPGAGP